MGLSGLEEQCFREVQFYDLKVCAVPASEVEILITKMFLLCHLTEHWECATDWRDTISECHYKVRSGTL